MKRLFILALGVCLLTGCNGVKSVQSESSTKAPVIENLIGLTKEQMLEDYDYLWKTLSENYPYFGVVKRMGIDVKSIYETYKERIENCTLELEFASAIRGAMYELQGAGHIEMIGREQYEMIKNIYEQGKEVATSEDIEAMQVWFDALENPLTIKNYELLSQMSDAMNGNPKGKEASSQVSESQGDFVANNLTTKVIEQDKIAYMKIESFLGEFMNKDKEKLFNFYEEVQDYEHLIIDISENVGGSSYYWRDLIVSPNIEESIDYKNYMLFMMGDNNKSYIHSRFNEEIIKPIDELPSFEKLVKEDQDNLTHFVETKEVVQSLDGQKAFNGKIWVLVSEKVYSAAEEFTAFCKQTGFATLVGTSTGGDGIGVDPVYSILPNSGLLVKYSMIYGINPDGSNNEEFGTLPDILFTSNKANSILDTCLKAIKEE